MVAIIHQTDKRSSITYAYESISYWNKTKKQSRAKRTLIGRVDKQSADLMIDFYDTLAKQQQNSNQTQNYSQALRDAKLSMIHKQMHPFYWSGFVLIGE